MKIRHLVGKTAVLGAKDRETNEVRVAVVEGTGKPMLQGFVADRTEETAAPSTSTARYTRMSLWSMMERDINGVYHHISPKHTARFTTEFSGRRNSRPKDTIDQIQSLIRGMEGKRLRYKDLTTEPRL